MELVIVIVVSVVSLFGFFTAMVMSKHQEKMAELINQREGGNRDMAPLVKEMVAMKEQMMDLNEKVNQQTIELDEVKALGKIGTVAERLSPPDIPVKDNA